MKKIIHNDDNLSINDINNYINRAKLLLVNSNSEVAVVLSDKNYFLLGGHVENDETDFECLKREIQEEMGVSLYVRYAKKIFAIDYYAKNFPNNGVNSLSSINYYFLKSDIKPNKENLNLTDEEKEGNFHIEFIKLCNVIDVLTKSLEFATRPFLVEDTIEVIKEYINNYL